MPALRLARPIWLDQYEDRRVGTYPALRRSIDADVAMVGGGVTGTAVASRLAPAGLRVAVLEAARVGYIGPHRRYPRHLFALEYGGNGMTFGFLAARMIEERLSAPRHARSRSVRVRADSINHQAATCASLHADGLTHPRDVHHGRAPDRVVGRARRGLPRVEVTINHHDVVSGVVPGISAIALYTLKPG